MTAREDAARAIAVHAFCARSKAYPCTTQGECTCWNRSGEALRAALVISDEDVEEVGLKIETMERLRRGHEDRPGSDYRILAKAALECYVQRKLSG